MKLIGPDVYSLKYTPDAYTVLCAKGRPNFSGIASSKAPKLYIASIDGAPVYVGATKRPMGERMRVGWKAAGDTGYYGYQWRHNGSEAKLHVWAHDDAVDRSHLDMETVEAEVVFLIRQAGQWPLFQTEIHFHRSNECHRQVAAEIFATYSAWADGVSE